MFQDLRYGLRGLLKNPAFALVAILTLALGIGANISVFRVVNAMLLRALPGVVQPENLAAIYRTQKDQTFDNLSYPDYLDYRRRSRSFSGLAAHSPVSLTFERGAGEAAAERLRGDLVTANYFDVLEVKSAVGRLLNPDDNNSVAVVSYGLWQRKFGGDPSILGARIRLNGSPFTVIGVAGGNFRGTVTDDQFDVWVPMDAVRHLPTGLSPGILEDRAAGWIWIFGRLNTGISLAHARVESQTIAAQLAQAYPATNDGRSVNLARGIGMYPDDRAEIRGLLGLLSAAVAVLLLISCANVAGLFLVRASRRSREIAVRLAVGAGRARLLRQFATEGLLLAALAGCVGLLFSEWVTAAVVSFGHRMSSFRHLDFGLDGHVLAFTMVCCAAASVLFALAPVTHSTKVDLTGALRAGGSGGGHPRTRLRSALVAGQVALSFILLSASGVLLRDLLRILATHPGFETNNIALMSIDLTSLPYSQEKNLSLEEQILEQVAHLPGVASATLAGTVPPQDLSGREPIFYPGQEPPPEVLHGRSWAYGLWVDVNTVAPNYFETLRIPLLHGRDFSSRDRVGAPGTVILSEKLAQRLWPHESAIGKRIAWPDWNGPRRPPFEVVGVAADAKYRSLTGESPLLMYIPAWWNYGGRTHVVARTASDPAGLIAGVEAAVHQVDRAIPVYAAETMREHRAESLWQQRMAAGWIGAFSVLALLLAAVGLYGVVAQSVAQRTREAGIRIALGAAPGEVSRLVLREGMALGLIGLAIGIPIALFADAALGRLVEGVSGIGATMCAASAAMLLAVILAACWIPARRAARVDPIVALRCE